MFGGFSSYTGNKNPEIGESRGILENCLNKLGVTFGRLESTGTQTSVVSYLLNPGIVMNQANTFLYMG